MIIMSEKENKENIERKLSKTQKISGTWRIWSIYIFVMGKDSLTAVLPLDYQGYNNIFMEYFTYYKVLHVKRWHFGYFHSGL